MIPFPHGTNMQSVCISQHANEEGGASELKKKKHAVSLVKGGDAAVWVPLIFHLQRKRSFVGICW